VLCVCVCVCVCDVHTNTQWCLVCDAIAIGDIHRRIKSDNTVRISLLVT